jgi:hypothetical protein
MTPVEFTPEQLADLQASGLTAATTAAAGLYAERDAERVRELLGSYLSAKTVRRLGPCLVIPYCDPAGGPMTYWNGDGADHPFARLKPAKPRVDKGGRPVKYESPAGAPPRAYFPPGTRAAVLANPLVQLLITEGEKKALCADQHGFRCVGLGGVSSWSVKRERDAHGKAVGVRELIPDLTALAWQGRVVVIVYDSDLGDKPEVQWERWHLGEALRERGADVRVVDLPAAPDGGKCGLDDYLVARGPDALRERIAAAGPPARPAAGDPRPKIVLGTDEYRVNAEAIAALAPMPDLYQRGGLLCRVVRTDAEPDPRAAVRRPPGSPVVRPLPTALLRERLTRAARWVAIREKSGELEEVPAHPPDWCVAAVHARESWPLVRHLNAVVNHPVVLPDGSLLAADGYDPGSRLLVALPVDLRLCVPETPTRADVAAALRLIDDAIADFPFERPEHRAAWYAGLLTPLAWFAFDGPAPMTLIDGNTRGVGKGLLADVIALTLTGRRFPVMSYSADKEELRKKVTSLAMAGERLVLLDNLAGAVGNDVLDMALTADWWRDRVLGVNRVYDGPLHVSWFATGNNVQLGADTSRRCSHCRLESPLERPELRADVRYPDLRRHVREHRGALLSAALTILRGWYAAGRPCHGLPPWGSFEGWSGVVREAVVWAGLPDPGETRMSLQSSSDRDATTMSVLIDALERADPCRRGMTTAEIVDAVRRPADPAPEWHADMKTAVEEMCGRLDGRTLGYRLRHFARRNFGGKMVDRAAAVSATNSIRWAVFPAGSGNRPGPSPASPVSPDPGPAGDAGDTGDDPARPPGEVNGEPTRRRFRNNDRRREL